MQKKIIFITLILIISVFTFSVISLNIDLNKETISTSSTLSNKKIGWGIKRNDNHIQPDLGSTNKRLLEEYMRNSGWK